MDVHNYICAIYHLLLIIISTVLSLSMYNLNEKKSVIYIVNYVKRVDHVNYLFEIVAIPFKPYIYIVLEEESIPMS